MTNLNRKGAPMITRRGLATLAATILLTTTTVTVVAADSHDDPSAITGIDWSLHSMTFDGRTTEVSANVGASLRLEDDATGSAGCNDFFGNYLLDGSELTFGPLAVTKKLCEGVGQDTEDAYLAVLSLVASWTLTGGGLSLRDVDGAEVLAYTASDSGIDSLNWLLRTQSVDGSMANIPADIVVSLRLDDGTASGTGGCNRYSGSYMLEGESLTFGPAAATLMACVGPAGDVEAAYLANMASVATWASDGATLALNDVLGNEILAYAAQPPTSVVGSWLASGINNGVGGVVSSDATPSVTAVFTGAGELNGSDGCNNYFGSYEVDGDGISIGPLGTTRKACPDDLVTQAATEYQLALANATTWAVTDTGDLELRDDDGSLQVRYLPAEG
jgi:heat shock protein HslJ